MVDARKAEILEGTGPERAQDAVLRIGRVETAGGDPFKQRAKLGDVHGHGLNC